MLLESLVHTTKMELERLGQVTHLFMQQRYARQDEALVTAIVREQRPVLEQGCHRNQCFLQASFVPQLLGCMQRCVKRADA